MNKGDSKNTKRMKRKVKKLQWDIQVMKFMLQQKERQINMLLKEQKNGENETDNNGEQSGVGEGTGDASIGQGDQVGEVIGDQSVNNGVS